MSGISKRFSYDESGISAMVEFLKWKIVSEGLDKYRFWEWENSVIFLAWAPGAWKTEFIESVNDSPEGKDFIVLDTDEYRGLFEGYNWGNASEFQQLASRVMDKMYSFCMREGLRVIIDGTFAARKEKIDENIAQCLRRKRYFTIVFVYQDPVISYMYTKIREAKRTRNVPFEDFVRKYFESIENVFRIGETYPIANIQIVLKKRSDNPISEKIYDNIRSKEEFYAMLESELDEVEKIDRHWSVEYNESELRERLDVLDVFMTEMKEDPVFAQKVFEETLKMNHDSNER